MDWGAGEIYRLRLLAAQGLTASEIARVMGATSRSAVLSIMRRKNIGLARAQGIRVRAKVPEPEPRETAPEPEPEPVAEPSSEPVTTLDLKAGDCKFPLNDGPRWLHCGAPAKGSYCAAHQALSYSKSHRDAAA